MEIRNLLNEKKIYFVSRTELRSLNASALSDGDIVRVGKYFIHIRYGEYKKPSLHSFVENSNFKVLGCTPGCRGSRPYYIDDFLHK